MSKKKLNRKKEDPSIPVYTGKMSSEEVDIQLFKYNKELVNIEINFEDSKFKGFDNDNFQYWLNIHGIHNVEKILNICNKTKIHSLTIQDILDVEQRPKFQFFENYWFFSIKSILPSKDDKIESEQLSFILGKNYLISFQEKKADYFSHVRKRIKEDIGIVRERSSDYLLFLLLESILDNYVKSLHSIEIQLEQMGIFDINTDPSPNVLKTFETYQSQIYKIKKTILPIKEFVTKIEREELRFINQKHIKYFYELKDICLSIIDDSDQLEMRIESNINLFFSLQGHRMNQVMKTLTIVATIFIPLTFIAGIYGMNFTNMPELHWKWGYFGVWIIIFIVFVSMLTYFRRKKWF